MIRTTVKIAMSAVGATLAGMLFVGVFVGALHQPAPRQVPVGVAGPAAAARQVGADLARHSPGAFTVTAYPDAAAARQAIDDRDVDAALVPGPGGPQLLVAGAAGPFATQAVTGAFQAEAAAAGQHLTVTDIRPLPPGDPTGIAPLFVFLGLALPGAVFGIMLAGVVGKRLNGPAKLASLAGFAILTALAATWITDGMTGALPGNPAGLIGIVALTAFAVSTAYTAAYRLAGLPLAVALLLLFVPVGISAAGGVLGPAFITSWYAQLGSGLPASAAMPAIRDVVSFGGHALAGPLLVLCLWAGMSAIVLALPRPRLPRRPRSGHAPAAGPADADPGQAAAGGEAEYGTAEMAE